MPRILCIPLLAIAVGLTSAGGQPLAAQQGPVTANITEEA